MCTRLIFQAATLILYPYLQLDAYFQTVTFAFVFEIFWLLLFRGWELKDLLPEGEETPLGIFLTNVGTLHQSKCDILVFASHELQRFEE